MSAPKIMTDDEMNYFIKNIERYELDTELRLLRQKSYLDILLSKYPLYLTAVCVTLIELGYDANWVEGKFRDALDNYYHI